MDNLRSVKFSEINLSDTFFNSLKDSYIGFEDWFRKKASEGREAFVYTENDRILDFLYLKDEKEPLIMDGETLPCVRRLKVGTFKIERRGTNRGERFMKKILDAAVQGDYQEVYVTMFNDSEELMHLQHFFEKYGFQNVGTKSNQNGRAEVVLLRNMVTTEFENPIKNYPFVKRNTGNKYMLSIYPKYHTQLFSDSMLKNESFNILQDTSETNSIFKIYICWMPDVIKLKPNDKVIIYRTNDGLGSAYYRSVATSLCTIQEVHTNRDFANIEQFLDYCRCSVFNRKDLQKWYSGKTCFIIKMLYNVAFTKRVIRKTLIERLNIPTDMYWGFFKLSDNQFNGILNYGEADERYFID